MRCPKVVKQALIALLDSTRASKTTLETTVVQSRVGRLWDISTCFIVHISAQPFGSHWQLLTVVAQFSVICRAGKLDTQTHGNLHLTKLPPPPPPTQFVPQSQRSLDL